ncbi:MAG: DNA translocase FtsK [Mailhella sp.]|nr:DNA translocase FtsK [Mailhella sp.]
MELSFSISWLLVVSGLVGWIADKFPSRGGEDDEEDVQAESKAPRFPFLADWLARRKKQPEVVPVADRPVLDIMLPSREEEAAPASPASVIALPYEEKDEPFIIVPEEETNDAGNDVSDDELTRLLDMADEGLARSASQDISEASEARPLTLELVSDIPATTITVPDSLPDVAAEESPVSASVFSDEHLSLSLEEAPGSSMEAGTLDLMPEDMVSAQPAEDAPAPLEQPAPRATHFPFDEAYASVDEAVARAMEHQEELEASAQAEPAPIPVLPKRKELVLPSFDLLAPLPEEDSQSRPDRMVLATQGDALITCLKNFNVNATLANITPGPVVTMFEVRPAPGVKATRITNLANDLAMSLKAVAVRMQAPVPGTDTVGVEVPNEKRGTVRFREIVENDSFRQARSLLTIALGKDTGGRPVSADLAKMPHLLVAGATGAGKSVCLNAIILSLLYRARPDEVQMILVDPKQVELSMYADLPHLVHPVVTDMDITKNALLWAIDEMNRRLKIFSTVKVRNITGFNERQARLREQVGNGGPVPLDEHGQPVDLANMPFLVIIVDELADLMMVKRKEVEGSIVRLAQLARAAGIHLIIATQRPSVDVVTGLIKANFPCRIAFKVTSGQDSRTILDGAGAEKLLGMGDMLFKPNGGNIQRLHGAFVSDDEVSAVVEYWKKQQKPNYQVDFSEFGNEDDDEGDDFGMPSSRGNDLVDDPIYNEAVQFVMERGGKISISLLQRRFRIGFNRAARFVEQMDKDGIRNMADGPRTIGN